MKTSLAIDIANTPQGREADAILRSCVHCGFCTATCPTYQLTGDELDGPRGRIYLIKALLEGEQPTRTTRHHLDRCLTCHACETTCPSGVRYTRLLDIGRELVQERVPRTLAATLKARLLRAVLPHRRRFAAALRLGQLARPLLGRRLARKVPPPRSAGSWPHAVRPRRMLLLESCGQAGAVPATNAAAARVLDHAGIQLLRIESSGCCGAISLHLSAGDEARAFARRNIDAWWPEVKQGAEAIVITASGCGPMVRDYGDLLADDPAYAEKARRIAACVRDLSELVAEQPLSFRTASRERVAWHAPCSLQHGQRLGGLVEGLLERAGYQLLPVADSHLCCGSAGTYSLLQPELSQQLLDNKLAALQSETPDLIATANIGCQLHLETAAQVPVRHWIELIDDALCDS